MKSPATDSSRPRPWPIAAFTAALLLAGTAPGVLFAQTGVPAPPPAAEDSLEEFAPQFDPADWDSVTAAYDSSIRHDSERRILPRYGLRFDKTEGLHLEGGVNVTDRRLRIGGLDLRGGYDLGRERPIGSLRLRVDLDRRVRWGLEVEAADQVRPFGNYRPYGNTWFTLFAGHDAICYQRERRLGLAVALRFAEDRQARLGWVRVEQDSLRPVTDFRFFGNGEWMERNEAAEHFVGNGLRFHLRRGPSYEEETVIRGLITEAELLMFGGAWLGGSREFSRLQADLWYTRPLARAAALHLRGSGSLATGNAPRQVWPDLGGAAGLRAFPPRGGGFADSLVGNSRLYCRAEFQSPGTALRVKRIKWLRGLGLKLVPFAEAGAIWGLQAGGAAPRIDPIRAVDDLRAPRRGEIHWDLGFGLRRNIDYSGILSFVEVDLAWPMGFDTAPPRFSVQFSRDGLD